MHCDAHPPVPYFSIIILSVINGMLCQFWNLKNTQTYLMLIKVKLVF